MKVVALNLGTSAEEFELYGIEESDYFVEDEYVYYDELSEADALKVLNAGSVVIGPNFAAYMASVFMILMLNLV